MTTTNTTTINLCRVRKGKLETVKTFEDITKARQELRSKSGKYILQYWGKRG